MQQPQQSAGDSFANSRVCGKCVEPRQLFLHAGPFRALLPAPVPQAALSRVSLLACGQAYFGGVLVQAKRPQEKLNKHLAAQLAGAWREPKATFIIKRKAKPARRGLTLRSSGAPTAGHQRPVGGTRYIFTVRALASCRCRPLNSNVRQRKVSMSVLEAVTAISLVLRRQRDWQSPHAQPRRAVRTIHTTCMLRQRGAGGTRGARQRSD